ncbi:heme exporter protein CcmD [Mesorhizobium sp. YIM 152430]|uniref:heme exporter protein CcmD n=1 Tax=Mesorhizobium sp. YIM 152430 TaxID=3031761 RepID=UPI0023DA3BFD|nr:heme exporter protein CcmD [Mesorhizobium sp. YIM 152430]MDF1600613.1 heme exporter protein CcmD [Mesorhizobium sp. YIM 152430]
MSHVAYVSAAYGTTILVLAGIALWLVADHRARRRELADLEARGVRRRSQAKP